MSSSPPAAPVTMSKASPVASKIQEIGDYTSNSNNDGANGGASVGLDIPTPTSIEVLIRVRPLLGHESDEGSRNASTIVSTLPDNTTVAINHPSKQLQCKYDFSFPPQCSQADIYDRVSQCATALANGFNATIFAYGQTGSGKTHTMFGPDGYDVRRAR